MTSTLHPTLTRQATPLRSAALMLGGAALVAVCAQISLPLTPVPLTLQTLAVLLVGAALGSRQGAGALLLYLAAGAAGLPVFAGGGASLLRAGGGLTPTLGYLIGFVLAAGLVGWLCERFAADRTPWGTALAMLAGNAVIYAVGLPVLGLLVNLHGQALLTAGLTPFLLGDLIKLLLAAALLPGAWALLRRR
ncbi:biotin transporter BioY [Deinococcus irradiatisoli]|uniref:Biotin transporter n=1 Tax=Deinococcus irradiatisoli TaxID=2202254 RepID=A0A2Z3JKE3_9DEIO|nr:biotin transporter BioY [Deinococcus irradiatisoli]AWN24346.1 biotin transporter BioY [Deinococcus irradiatisoli]